MRISILIICVLSVISCRSNFDNPEVQRMYDEVMEVHDKVMPEISTLNKLKRKIRKLEIKDETSLQMIKGIEDADEAMMSWMADFKPDKSQSVDLQKDYLAREKVKIQTVSDQMYEMISKAEDFLNNFQNEE